MPAPELAPLDRTTGSSGSIALTLTGGISFGTAGDRKFGAFKGAHRNGEIVTCAIGDEPPGALEEDLGTAENPKFKEGDEVVVAGLWKDDWFVVSAIGIRPL